MTYTDLIIVFKRAALMRKIDVFGASEVIITLKQAEGKTLEQIVTDILNVVL